MFLHSMHFIMVFTACITLIVPSFADSLKTADDLYQHRVLETFDLNPTPSSKIPKTIQATGIMQQGGFLVIRTRPNTQIIYDGVTIKSDHKGRAFIGFHRDEKATNIAIETMGNILVTPQKRNYAIQKITGVPSKYVEPPKAIADRIKQDRTDKANAIAPMTPIQFFGKKWIVPLAQKHSIRLSGVYGSQRFYNNKPRSPHYGIDFVAPKGATVIAPMDGTVTLAKDLYFAGNTIYINHGGGLFSAFLHLSKINVKVGEKVTIGQKIGEVGSTGRSTGNHLDWGVNCKHKRLDPAYFVGHTIQ